MALQNLLQLTHRGRVERLVGPSHEPLTLQSTLAATTGAIGGHPFLAVATDPAVTSGAIGVAETRDLRWLIARARREEQALVLVIDSAGARVSEGVAIQGALRRVFADLLAARAAGLRTVAILGRNVFGGASMLAMLCDARLYAQRTRLAMTGPAVLQSHNGVVSQMVADTIAAPRRLERDRAGTLIEVDSNTATSSVRDSLYNALAQHSRDFDKRLREQGDELRTRLTEASTHSSAAAVQAVEAGALRLAGARAAGPADVIHLSAALREAAAGRERIVLECEWAGHSMRLADEDRLLSEYLAYLCGVIHSIEADGTRVCLHVAGALSGGLYIALASASSEVRLMRGGHVLTLPQQVLDAFVNMPAGPDPGADTLIEHGAVDAIAD